MTGRLPFDPRKMAQSAKPDPAPADRPLTVSQLATRIADIVGAGLPGKVRIIGEVSGFRERTHWYFDLKDAEAVVSCAMFAAAARKSRFTPTNGQEVVATGRVEFYEKQGRISLLVERLDPVGVGAQDLAFKALVEELRKLGWLDDSRKRPLPMFPRKIGVVTSMSGAALQDVIATMRKRCPAVGIALVDARVQGEGAAAEVAAAIRWLGASHAPLGIDAVLVTRGGGSKEDLWAFNERIVAEAIVNSPIPVVAAIGHETDTTIAELVADLRCSTPTQAAMRLAPDRASLDEQVEALSSRLRTILARDVRETRRHTDVLTRSLRQSASSRVQAIAHQLEKLSGRLEAQRPAAAQARRESALRSAQVRLAAAIQARLRAPDLDALWHRLHRAETQTVERADLAADSLAKRLTAVGPESVLSRGYSYTMREDGVLVRTIADARPGDALRTRVSDGVFRSIVEQALATPPPAPPPTRPKRKTPPRDQMDLFGGNR